MVEVPSRPTVLVTGATGALGSAISEDLIDAGFNVVGLSRKDSNPTAHFKTFVADVTSVESLVRARVSLAESNQTPSHIVTCSAAPGSALPFLDSSDTEFRELFDVDFFGVVNVARVFGQGILDARGSMTNLTSFHTVATYPNRVSYVAAKSALEGFSRALAVEWGSKGARVNCVAPGPIESPRTAGFLARDPAARKGMTRRTPLGRLGVVTDVSGVVAFLVSERARHVTGQTIVVDGGWTSNSWWGDVSGQDLARGGGKR